MMRFMSVWVALIVFWIFHRFSFARHLAPRRNTNSALSVDAFVHDAAPRASTNNTNWLVVHSTLLIFKQVLTFSSVNFLLLYFASHRPELISSPLAQRSRWPVRRRPLGKRGLQSQTRTKQLLCSVQLLKRSACFSADSDQRARGLPLHNTQMPSAALLYHNQQGELVFLKQLCRAAASGKTNGPTMSAW